MSFAVPGFACEIISWGLAPQVVDEQKGPTTKREYDIAMVPVGDGLIGRVVDFLGRPPGSAGQLGTDALSPLLGEFPDMACRQQIHEALVTGVKVPPCRPVCLPNARRLSRRSSGVCPRWADAGHGSRDSTRSEGVVKTVHPWGTH